MRNDARPIGENAPRDDAGRQAPAAGGPSQTPERMRAEREAKDTKKPFVTAADPADEDTNVTHPAARRSRP